MSVEADLYPKNKPERWNLIDGCIGEGSPFHETFGYYAQGVEEGTATLPAGWKERLVPIRNEKTRGATALCLEIHDLLIAKYVAGREKDTRFARAAFRAKMVDPEILRARLEATSIDPEQKTRIAQRIAVDASA